MEDYARRDVAQCFSGKLFLKRLSFGASVKILNCKTAGMGEKRTACHLVVATGGFHSP